MWTMSLLWKLSPLWNLPEYHRMWCYHRYRHQADLLRTWPIQKKCWLQFFYVIYDRFHRKRNNDFETIHLNLHIDLYFNFSNNFSYLSSFHMVLFDKKHNCMGYNIGIDLNRCCMMDMKPLYFIRRWMCCEKSRIRNECLVCGVVCNVWGCLYSQCIEEVTSWVRRAGDKYQPLVIEISIKRESYHIVMNHWGVLKRRVIDEFKTYLGKFSCVMSKEVKNDNKVFFMKHEHSEVILHYYDVWTITKLAVCSACEIF